MTDLPSPPGAALAHEQPHWRWPVTVTFVFDLVALAATWYAYIGLSITEAVGAAAPLNWRFLVAGLVVLAVLVHAVGIARARRVHEPWVLPAFVAFFVFAALFALVWASVGVATIPTSVG